MWWLPEEGWRCSFLLSCGQMGNAALLERLFSTDHHHYHRWLFIVTIIIIIIIIFTIIIKTAIVIIVAEIKLPHFSWFEGKGGEICSSASFDDHLLVDRFHSTNALKKFNPGFAEMIIKKICDSPPDGTIDERIMWPNDL